VDTVSRAKAVRLPQDLTGVDLLFLNEAEAEAISGVAEPEAAVARLRQMGAAAVILTRGGAGAIASDAGGSKIVPPCPAGIVDVTGAGDAFIAGTLASLVSGQTLQDAATAGAGLAARTVESEDSVRGDVSPELLRGLWPSKVSAPDRAR
jgi:pseudouridine kinase